MAAGYGWRHLGLRTVLTESLPLYMVPARIVVLPQLPVNANGKLDGRALDLLAGQALAPVTGGGVASASTDTEQSLCEIFAEQFNGVAPHIDDDFFSLGLDSIVAISLVHKARRLGLALSPRMVFTAPTIRQLAAAIDAGVGPDAAVESVEYGEVPPLPIVSWLYEYGSYRRFSQAVLLRLPVEIDRPSMELMLQLLLDGHDTLRSILTETPAGPRLITREPGVVRAADVLTCVELPNSTDDELSSAITQIARRVTDEIDPQVGAMVRAAWFSGPQRGDVLLITAHHLAVDVVSWHIMLGDVAEGWRSLKSGTAPKLLPEFSSYRRWSQLMWQRAGAQEVQAQREYWIAQVRDPDPALGGRHPDPTYDTWSSVRVTPVVTPVEVCTRVLATLSRDEGVREFLLAAVSMTIASWRRTRGQDPASGTLVALEGHGRADAVLDTDTTNTVGWFTAAYPVRLGMGAAAVDEERAEADPGAVRDLLDSVTAHSERSRMRVWITDCSAMSTASPNCRKATEAQIMFNYMGRMDLSGAMDQPWAPLTGTRRTASRY